MQDEHNSLANAYFDGEVTDAERMAAEADQDVMAIVEDLRTVQQLLRDTGTPNETEREEAIAAAMAEFAQVDRPAAIVVPLRPRPSYGRYLGVAAAIVVLGLFGLVVANQNAGDSDSDSAGDVDDLEQAQFSSTEADSVDSSTGATAEAGSVVSGAAPTDESSQDSGDDSGEVSEEESADDSAAEPAPEADDSDDDLGASVSDEAGSTPATQRDLLRLAVMFALDPQTPIGGEDELAGYGMYLRQLEDRGDMGPTPNTRCVYSDSDAQVDILDEATYVWDDKTQEMLIAIDRDTGQTLALDPDTCEVVVVGTLP